MNRTLYNREIVTDGKFVYNVCKERELVNDEVVERYKNVCLIGVIGEYDSLTLPSTFQDVRISFIEKLKFYRQVKPLDFNEKSVVPFPMNQYEYSFFTTGKIESDPLYFAETPADIKEIRLGKTELQERCFEKSNIERVEFYDGWKEIPSECFAHSKKIKEGVLMPGVRTIKALAFSFCSALSDINLPDSIKAIGELAFQGTNLTSVVIPSKVERVKYRTFADCKNLQYVIISPGVKFIHPSAFVGSPNVNIVAFGNSYAHKYALREKIPFYPLEEIMCAIEDHQG